MPRQRLVYVDAGLSARITSMEVTRSQLFHVDVDRKKRIDDIIDYFGGEPHETRPGGSHD